MESKYVEHSYKSVERNSNPLELIYIDICDMKLTLSHDGCIIYKFGFTQNLYGGTILTAKKNNKKLVF